MEDEGEEERKGTDGQLSGLPALDTSE